MEGGWYEKAGAAEQNCYLQILLLKEIKLNSERWNYIRGMQGSGFELGGPG